MSVLDKKDLWFRKADSRGNLTLAAPKGVVFADKSEKWRQIGARRCLKLGHPQKTT